MTSPDFLGSEEVRAFEQAASTRDPSDLSPPYNVEDARVGGSRGRRTRSISSRHEPKLIDPTTALTYVLEGRNVAKTLLLRSHLRWAYKHALKSGIDPREIDPWGI